MGNFVNVATLFILSLLLYQEIDASYHVYEEGEALMVKVNSLTSFKSIFPLSFYDLPFCLPQSSSINRNPENLGQILMGDMMQSSPYQFKMNINRSFVHICDTEPLSDSQIQLYKTAIDQNYRVTMFLDGLPSIRPNPEGYSRQRTGSPVGYKHSQTYHAFNHLKLTVLVRKKDKSFIIVGFEVDPLPCSIGPRIYSLQPLPIACDFVRVTHELRENQTIRFTYGVEFQESDNDVQWESRWDAYVDKKSSVVQRLGASIDFACRFVIFCAIVYFRRRARRRAAVHKEKDDESAILQVPEMTIHSPSFPVALCAVIGSGVQILCMTCATLLIGWLGFLSSSSRGSFLTLMIYCHMAAAIAGSYTAVRLLRAIDFEKPVHWTYVTWQVACVFPAISAVGLASLNATFALIQRLLLLWGSINVPLAFLGGYLATRSRRITYLSKKGFLMSGRAFWRLVAWVLLLLLGCTLAPLCLKDVNHLVKRFWVGTYFTDYGYLLGAMIVFVIACGEVGVMCKKIFNDKWWWSSFLGPASSGIWIFIYFIMNQWYELKYFSLLSSTVYVGYCLLFSLNFMVAVGTVGFLAALMYSRFE